jgi:predicted Zn finger-like uncharacterized protein/prepilin-type processing-associated H-X9-DG protein
LSETNVATCPHCGKQYSITPEQVGQVVQCTGCQQTFSAGLPPLPPGAAGSVNPFYANQAGQYDVGGPKLTNGMAITSLVCGLLGCFPLAGLAAIIFGIFGLLKTKDPRYGGKGMSITGIVLGALFMPVILISIMLPALNRARETAYRVKCASNLRQIGTAIILYENDNQGAYPPDLGTLVKTEDISINVFACPASNTSVPSGLPSDQQAAWVNSNSDYIYIGAGYKRGEAESSVVAYEKDDDHHDGMNLLFADGHVEFENLYGAHQAIEATKKAHGQETAQ